MTVELAVRELTRAMESETVTEAARANRELRCAECGFAMCHGATLVGLRGPLSEQWWLLCGVCLNEIRNALVEAVRR
jgi:hypothetical protein